MVASVAWVPEQEGHAGLAIWGDDETTSEKEGMSKGEARIVLFDKSEDKMCDVKVNDGSVVITSLSKMVLVSLL